MLPDIPKASWRPELEGWAEDILPYYEQLARDLAPDAVVVELGVAHGRSAVFLAEQLLKLGKPNVELYCVDVWPGYHEFSKILRTIGPDWGDGDRIVSGRATGDEMAMLRLLRVDGVRAARLFDAHSVDVIFEDSDHSRVGVSRTIAAWRSKVKPGGIFAGHDYSREDWPGVVQAVDEAFPKEAIRRPTRSVWEVRL